MRLQYLTVSVAAALIGVAQPAPTAAERRQPRPQPSSTAAQPAVVSTVAAQIPSAAATAPVEGAPTEATLGAPVYPNAVYLTAYDAGRGQSYYIFGVNRSFDEMVQYYAVILDERGDRVFSAPPVHVFETGRFREERMAFEPSITIKDYTWNGSEGYLNPSPGAEDRYPTIIQIVPPPAGQADR